MRTSLRLGTCMCILEEATFSSLSRRPQTKDLNNAFNMVPIQGTNYKATQKQGIDLKVRS